MTREEAIKLIKLAQAEVEWEYPMDYAAAFDLAIKALEQQPCGNTISRQAVLDLFAEKCDTVRPYHEVWQAVKELPPVKPERKTGKWIISHDKNAKLYGKCNNCGMRNYAGCTNYCPDCSAKMEVN